MPQAAPHAAPHAAAPSGPIGFFKALFSRHRRGDAPAAPPRAAPDVPRPKRYPQQDAIENLMLELDGILQAQSFTDPTLLPPLAQRDKTLRGQYAQALATRTVPPRDTEPQTLTAVLTALLQQFQVLKADAKLDMQRDPSHPYAKAIPRGAVDPQAVVAAPAQDGANVYAALPGERVRVDAAGGYSALPGRRRAAADAAVGAVVPVAPPIGDLGAYGSPEQLNPGRFGQTTLYRDDDDHKLVLKTALDSDEGRAALRNEAYAFAKVGDHPNIVKCHGSGHVGGADGADGLILEFIDGPTATKAMGELRERYERGEISSEDFWCVVRYTVKQMLAAVQHLRDHGIVHNDLRLDNVMIDAATGQVKVIDLGLGTAVNEYPADLVPAPFSAPETLSGERSNKNSDTYMVGGTAYLLGEQHLFQYDMPLDAPHSVNDYAVPGKRYRDAGGVPINTPNVDTQRSAWKDGGDPAQVDRAGAAGKTPEHRFFARYKEASAGIGNAAMGAGPRNDARSGMGAGASLAEGLRPLLARARACGEARRYDEGLGLLEEILGRLRAAQRDPGDHQIATAYTDFINRTMCGDPTKRMSPEEAMRHPFITGVSTSDLQTEVALPLAEEEEAKARALLTGQLRPAPRVDRIDGDSTATDLQRWLDTFARDLDEIRPYQPEHGARRDELLAALRAQVKRPEPAFDPDAAEVVECAAELKALIDDALADRESRRVLRTEIAAAARRVDQLAKERPHGVVGCDKLLKTIGTLVKPGGSLSEARAQLDELYARLPD